MAQKLFQIEEYSREMNINLILEPWLDFLLEENALKAVGGGAQVAQS